MRWTLPLLALTILALLTHAESKLPPLRPIHTIPLPKVNGRFDHFAIDPAHQKLFVAALGNNTLEIIDLSTPKRLATIPNLPKPTGVAFIPDSNQILVATGDDGDCRFFDADSLELKGMIDNLPDADNVRYDPTSHRAYVGYGNGALAVIDTKSKRQINTIKLDAHPESFQLAQQSKEVYVNIPEAKQIVVIDREKNAVTKTWPLNEAADNFPMALDEPNQRLFIGCRTPARLLILNTNNGHPIATLPCVADTDDLFYDPALHRIYLTGGQGAISIIQQQDPDHYQALDPIQTSPGARTSFFAKDLHHLIVAIPHRDKQQPELRIFATPKADHP
jgi:YVTN family beta-propeller protein